MLPSRWAWWHSLSGRVQLCRCWLQAKRMCCSRLSWLGCTKNHYTQNTNSMWTRLAEFWYHFTMHLYRNIQCFRMPYICIVDSAKLDSNLHYDIRRSTSRVCTWWRPIEETEIQNIVDVQVWYWRLQHVVTHHILDEPQFTIQHDTTDFTDYAQVLAVLSVTKRCLEQNKKQS